MPCNLCSSGPEKMNPEDELVIDKMIISGPKKPQVALPANEVLEIPAPDEMKTKMSFTPAIDMLFDPKEESVVLLVDLPGASEKDIFVEVGEGMLSISGPRPKTELKERFGVELQLMAHERHTGFYCRRFQLPNNALEDTVCARYNAGVLEVQFKCVQRHEWRRVEIGAGPAAGDKGEKDEKKEKPAKK